MRTNLFSGSGLIAATNRNFRKHMLVFPQIIALMIVGLIVLSILDQLVSSWLSQVLAPQVSTVASVMAFNFIYRIILGAILFLWFTYTQGLLIPTAISEEKKSIQTIVKHFKKDYVRFLLLSAILVAIASAVIIPFYAFSIVTIFQIPFKEVIGTALLILFVIVLLACLWGLMFAPFIMLDLHATIKTTLKTNALLVRKKFGRIIKNMILPFAIIVAINFTIGATSGWIGTLLSLAYLLVVLPWLYSYIASLYRELKHA